jgi:hypothetical protein
LTLLYIYPDYYQKKEEEKKEEEKKEEDFVLLCKWLYLFYFLLDKDY